MPIPSAHKRWIVLQMLYRDLLTELDGHFVRMGVRYMPIKGAYLILAGLAEQIEARKMVDVDILVDQANIDRVQNYFVSCPNAAVTDDYWYFERLVRYRFGDYTILVEIHYLLNRPERFVLPPVELFERGIQKGAFLWLPCPEDALAIAVCHALVHFPWSGQADEIYNDLKVLAWVPELSWPLFEMIMAKTGIARFGYFLFLLFRLKKKLLMPSGERNPSFGMRILAGIFIRHYSHMPIWLRRLLFEIPFVRSPWRLIRGTIRFASG
jgi:hypothetical protein